MLIGEIQCKTWIHRLNDKNRWEEVDVVEVRQHLMQLKTILHQFKNPVVQPGTYKIKFSFPLPDIQHNTANWKGYYGLMKDESQHY
jgi:hypothetical protein